MVERLKTLSRKHKHGLPSCSAYTTSGLVSLRIPLMMLLEYKTITFSIKREEILLLRLYVFV